jgi:RHS repeat-associated protein
LGHTRLLLDGSGNAVNRYAYDAWGNLIEYEENVPNPFTWNGAYGYEWIPLTGLYHVGAREYDPRTGRWLQRDPIEASSGDPHFWRYCGNDPLNEVDSGFIAESKQGSQLSQSKKQAQNAVQGNPPGTEICPDCGGTGIKCDGLHEQIRITEKGTVKYAKGFLGCSECNGLGYRPKGGWKGRVENALNPIVARNFDTPRQGTPERRRIQERGDQYGCHTCGTFIPNSKDKKDTTWRADHVLASELCDPGDRQHFRPHCAQCSGRQGKRVQKIRNQLRSWGWDSPGPITKKCPRAHSPFY